MRRINSGDKILLWQWGHRERIQRREGVEGRRRREDGREKRKVGRENGIKTGREFFQQGNNNNNKKCCPQNPT